MFKFNLNGTSKDLEGNEYFRFTMEEFHADGQLKRKIVVAPTGVDGVVADIEEFVNRDSS